MVPRTPASINSGGGPRTRGYSWSTIELAADAELQVSITPPLTRRRRPRRRAMLYAPGCSSAATSTGSSTPTSGRRSWRPRSTAAPPAEPRTLVAAAEALLDELDDGWLRDQVGGLRTYAGRSGRRALLVRRRGEGCYGVRPVRTDEAVFADAHASSRSCSPGDGSLAERHERWRQSMLVPDRRIERTVTAVIEEARRQTATSSTCRTARVVTRDRARRALAGVQRLPRRPPQPDRGQRRPARCRRVDLLRLAIHETYPGHHAERAIKEHVLVRGRGLLEETIVLVPTPQSLDRRGHRRAARRNCCSRATPDGARRGRPRRGHRLRPGHALAVGRASEPLPLGGDQRGADVARAGASEAEMQAYLERWGLMTPEARRAHLIRFMTEPTSRSYIAHLRRRTGALPRIRRRAIRSASANCSPSRWSGARPAGGLMRQAAARRS